MESTGILKLVYAVFLGLLLALFVGEGIHMFYSPPVAPKYPIELNTYGKELNPEQQLKQQSFDRLSEQYRAKLKPYSRNVSALALGAAVILFGLSMFYDQRPTLIGNGLMLGGVFTLFYSIIRAFESENTAYTLGVIMASIAVMLYLGYRRFTRRGEQY